MGIYYIAANHTKREWLCGWCLGEVCKFFEWAANACTAGPLMALLRDRWAGDAIQLVADVDEERYGEVQDNYQNVSGEAARLWNAEVGRLGDGTDLLARTEPCCFCRPRDVGEDGGTASEKTPITKTQGDDDNARNDAR